MLAETVKEWQQQWKEEGLKEGLKEGLNKGHKEGVRDGQINLLLKQLELKFGPLSTELRKKIQAADTDTLSLWSERILTAHTLQEVVTDSF